MSIIPAMKKIAIIRRNGLGDLLCAFPLISYIQKHEPESHITLFVDRRNAPLLPYLPPVDRVVVLPAKGNKYLNLWRTARKHRKEFDSVYCTKTSPMKLMNFFLYWLKAKKQVAYVDESWHSRLVNHPLPFDLEKARNMHQALKGLQMVAPELEDVPEEFYPTLTIPSDEKPVSLSSPIVLACATTKRFENCLDVDRYATLFNRLHAERPISVLIIGQPQDKERAQAISERLKTPHVVHFPRNFEEFMLFLDAAEFYLVGDGGVGHIGAALGKKGVVLYGGTTPTEWRPLSNKMETFFHPTHVDHLNDEAIFQALKRKINSGRDN